MLQRESLRLPIPFDYGQGEVVPKVISGGRCVPPSESEAGALDTEAGRHSQGTEVRLGQHIVVVMRGIVRLSVPSSVCLGYLSPLRGLVSRMYLSSVCGLGPKLWLSYHSTPNGLRNQ